MTLSPFATAVNVANPGPHAVICDGALMFIYPTYLEAIDRAADLETPKSPVSVVRVDLRNVTLELEANRIAS
ncbi:hypothetical protein VT84_30675 [Gemmata sp. SH-PL17]|nr:hypothetical protein VT84_30675 [Gemmata sp. SH-PL17]